ncbi:MAG: HAD hydrolase-like protein [Candidatus Pacebacteria bacterium]|nr:HAD hydrolase-like protein [Candidatus Paceibacterota bacterium]
MIKSLIFDLNDTLDNTNEAIIRAFEAVLKKHFPAITQSKLQKFAEELMVFFWQADRLADLSYPEWTMEDIIKHCVKKWANSEAIEIDIDIFTRDYNAIRKRHLIIKPKMAKLIKGLPSYLLKFIISQGNSKGDIIDLLQQSNLAESDFTEIISTRLFKEENKPSINILKYILKKYSLKPEECLMIGDDVCADLMPAKILGMKTVLISNYVDELSISDSQLPPLIKKYIG